MPLNDQQLAAIQALEWVLDNNLHRRSGRSVAMAVAFVRIAGRNPGTWVQVIDHHPGRAASDSLFGTVVQLLMDFDSAQESWSVDSPQRAIRFQRNVLPPDWTPSEAGLGLRAARRAPRPEEAMQRMRRAPPQLDPFVEINLRRPPAVSPPDAIDEEIAKMFGEPDAPKPKEPPSRWERLLDDEEPL